MSTGVQRRRKNYNDYTRNKGNWKKLQSFNSKVKRVVTNLAEKKYSADYLVSDFPSISTAWTEVDYSLIPQGDDIFSQRQGRNIMVTEFYMYGVLVGGCTNSEFDDKYNTIRIVGTVSGVTTPLATAGATIHDIISKRADGSQVYKKFLDKYITLPPISRDSTGYLPSVKLVKIYKKFKKPIYIDYENTLGNTANKKLIISMISDSAGIPSPGFTIGHIAFHYKEL